MDFESYIQELKSYKQIDKHKRMIRFAAMLTEILELKGIKNPIVVGGLSIEIYTLNNYTTYDIDMVFEGRDVANDILIKLGFEKMSKDWFNANLGISVEVPDDFLKGSYEKVIKVPVGERYINVIGLEDIFVHRLQSAVAQNNATDYEWSNRLLYTYFEEVDIEYIKGQLHFPIEKNTLKKMIDEIQNAINSQKI